uniref:Putative secreted peptide n=1 Tax=Anopheles braziliensis TaxID=58242 RepID=A0A2M3ZN62_9DIPT
MFLLVGMRCDLIWLSTMSAAAALRPFLRLRNRNILDAFVVGVKGFNVEKGSSRLAPSSDVFRAGCFP